ncbi:MAG: alanine racemase [Pseudomonadota bacterium]
MSAPAYSTRPTLRVDLVRIKANYEALQSLTPRSKVAASVKADAYGLGAHSVGRALYGAGCRIFFVATAGEGKMLREAVGPNAAIYVFNGPAPRDKGVLLGAKLKPVINSIGQAKFWSAVNREVNDPLYTAIHIDTGMNRLGMTADEVQALSRDKSLWKALNPEWVMSHLACASQQNHPFNKEQLQRFKALSAILPPTPMSLASTAGIYLGKDYHFQMVRPGIGLYADQSTDTPEKEVSKTAVKLLAPILQIRDIKAGDSIGYKATHIAQRDMRLATIGAGYNDGVPVSLSNQGHAVIHDQTAPIVGRVSMDLTVLDITDIHLPVSVGGVVEFLGDRLSEQATEAGTIKYELLTRISQRVRRDYWKPRDKTDDRPKSSRPKKSPRQRSPGR